MSLGDLEDKPVRLDGRDGGSVKITAVAGTVLGTKKPVLPSDDENTDITTAPGIPIVKNDTSARTTGL